MDKEFLIKILHLQHINKEINDYEYLTILKWLDDVWSDDKLDKNGNK